MFRGIQDISLAGGAYGVLQNSDDINANVAGIIVSYAYGKDTFQSINAIYNFLSQKKSADKNYSTWFAKTLYHTPYELIAAMLQTNNPDNYIKPLYEAINHKSPIEPETAYDILSFMINKERYSSQILRYFFEKNLLGRYITYVIKAFSWPSVLDYHMKQKLFYYEESYLSDNIKQRQYRWLIAQYGKKLVDANNIIPDPHYKAASPWVSRLWDAGAILDLDTLGFHIYALIEEFTTANFIEVVLDVIGLCLHAIDMRSKYIFWSLRSLFWGLLNIRHVDFFVLIPGYILHHFINIGATNRPQDAFALGFFYLISNMRYSYLEVKMQKEQESVDKHKLKDRVLEKLKYLGSIGGWYEIIISIAIGKFTSKLVDEYGEDWQAIEIQKDQIANVMHETLNELQQSWKDVEGLQYKMLGLLYYEFNKLRRDWQVIDHQQDTIANEVATKVVKKIDKLLDRQIIETWQARAMKDLMVNVIGDVMRKVVRKVTLQLLDARGEDWYGAEIRRDQISKVINETLEDFQKDWRDNEDQQDKIAELLYDTFKDVQQDLQAIDYQQDEVVKEPVENSIDHDMLAASLQISHEIMEYKFMEEYIHIRCASLELSNREDLMKALNNFIDDNYSSCKFENITCVKNIANQTIIGNDCPLYIDAYITV